MLSLGPDFAIWLCCGGSIQYILVAILGSVYIINYLIGHQRMSVWLHFLVHLIPEPVDLCGDSSNNSKHQGCMCSTLFVNVKQPVEIQTSKVQESILVNPEQP
jgi:hypothetical protein